MVTPKNTVPPYISVNKKSEWIVAESAKQTTPTSISFDMLARFQQRQLQEKEQKLLQLYDQQQQRAHQVAQRGSAGSSGSNGSSHGNSLSHAGKVRQMFDERRQTNVKGIDKSYPLEPLNGKPRKPAATKAGPRRATLGPKRATSKPDVNSNVGAANRSVAAPPPQQQQQQRESYAKESYAASRVLYKDSVGQRENISRESFASSRGDYGEALAYNSTSLKQLNGHARNGQTYEINIDEVIDNEAMERNRMLAKFHSVDIDKRRRFSGDIENEQFPEDILHDAPDQASSSPAAAPLSRKSSLADAKAKPPSLRKSNATPPTKKPSPSGANARQSTVMKTTKSASLKIRKLPINKKTLDDRKKTSSSLKSNQTKEKPKKQCAIIKKSKEQSIAQKSKEHKSKGKENFPEKWNSLKSTPLICEIIRSHNRIEQSSETDGIGKVKTIVTKMENTVTEVKVKSTETIEQQSTESSKQSKLNSSSVSIRKKRPSLFSSELYKATRTTETTKTSLDKSKETLLKNIENEDQGDGLISQKEVSTPLRGNRESSVEHPSEYQEITIADQTIKVEKETEAPENPKTPASESASRMRRASFELKRMMFEQIQGREKISRRDSVESALRHFDSIGADAADYAEPVPRASTERLAKERKKSQAEESSRKFISQEISQESLTRKPDVQGAHQSSSDFNIENVCVKEGAKLPGLQQSGIKGFEKSTSAWSIRTSRDKELQHLKTPVKAKSLTAISGGGKKAQSRRKIVPKLKKSASKKLLEARDSIELARISVKPKSPGCRRKINFNMKTSPPTQEQRPNAKVAKNKNDEAASNLVDSKKKNDEAVPDSVVKKSNNDQAASNLVAAKKKNDETVPDSAVSKNKNDQAAASNITVVKKKTEETVTNIVTTKAKTIETASSSITTKTENNESVSNSVTTKTKNDEAASVKSQSFLSSNRVARLKNLFSSEQTCKTEKFSSSTTRNSSTDAGPKKVDSSIKAAESIVRKNVSPYPSSKSPDRTEKSRSTTKASTKLANRASGSTGDIASASENGFSTAARKSSVSAVDSPDSAAADSKNKSFDEKPGTPVIPAPRGISTVSPSQNAPTNRSSQGSTGARAKAKANAAAPTPAQRSSAPSRNDSDEGLTTCKICNRRFTSERITLHEQICAKTSQKKRKQFDTVTHRVRGTELESFVQKPTHKKQSKASVQKSEPQPVKSNWRRKHEDFINAIRSAKQMQTHLASGGKLSDLPPPPPTDNSDYIQCPHCSRKFNQAAAERHIPKCSSMQHNKPRAPPRSKR